MVVYLFTFIVFLVIVAAMCIGVIMGKKPIQSSCEGKKGLDIDDECQVCGGDPNKCENR